MSNEQPDVAEMWSMIGTCLKTAVEVSTWVMWRQRFNTNHPDHIRQQEILDPDRYAAANWFAAKALYMNNKDVLDAHYDAIIAGDVTLTPGVTREAETFEALRQVVEAEMNQHIENMLINEEEMPMSKYNPAIDDEDEDEIYALETAGKIDEEIEGEWDGDEFVPLVSTDDDDLQDGELEDFPGEFNE
jgi:hypothetical protein